MINYFKQYLPKKITYCPIIADSDKIYFSNKQRLKLRNEWKWSKNNVYVYSGTFGLYGLNKEFLFKLISLIKNIDNKAKFLFLLANGKSEFNSFIQKFNKSKKDFKYFSVSPNELYKFLSASDVGIHALPIQQDSFTRLGTKVVEYWCAGLPTLINNNVGEAADISKENDLGIVINLDDINKINFLDFSIFQRDEIRSRSLKFFDKRIVLKNYLKIYDNLIS